MTLKLKAPQLTPDLRSLCGRLANERCKAAVWAEARRLRQFAQQRMSEGASSVEVTGWLARQLTEAQAAQRSG
jgi:hypothetical protein